MGVVVFLWQKFEIVFFRLNGWCWRLLIRGWSVHGALAGRVDGCARPDSRFPSRRGGRHSLKRRNTFVETARERGAARFTSHESRQHRAAAGARARSHTDLGVERLQEWSAAARARPTKHIK